MKRFLAGLFAAVGLFVALPAFAQNTALILDYEPTNGSPEGYSLYLTPADGIFMATPYPYLEPGISVSFSGDNQSSGVLLSAPYDQLLKVGTYDNAKSGFLWMDGLPYLEIENGCNASDGEFEVKQVAYGADGKVASLHVTFTETCPGAPEPLHGELFYNSSDPLPPRNHITSPLVAWATHNQFFRYQIRGNNTPMSFAASNLPAGLSLDPSTGLISGVPQVEGVFLIPISATGTTGTESVGLTLTIDPPGRSTGPYTALYLNSDIGDPLYSGQVKFMRPEDGYFTRVYASALGAEIRFNAPDFQGGADYNLNFGPPTSGRLGVGPYYGATRSGSMTNPSMDVNGYEGCNETSGSFEVEEFAYRYDLLTAYRTTFEQHCDGAIPALRGEIWIDSMNAITSYPFATANRGQPFSFQLVANNLPVSYSASALPPGLSVDTADGVISGMPTIGGTFSVPVSATGPAQAASDRLDLTILPPAGDTAPVITSERSAITTIANPFTYQISANNTPTSFAASGLPPGTLCDPLTGLIGGAATAAGTFNAIITASNGSGTGGNSLTIVVLETAPTVTSTDHAFGSNGTPFNFQVTADNGAAAYDAIGLPEGLTIGNVSGLISGIPTEGGIFNVTLDAANSTGAGSQSFTLTVSSPAPTITSPLSANATAGRIFQYQIAANANPTSYGASGLPSGLSLTHYGLISGAPTTGGTYNVTLSATNATGTGYATLA